MWSTSEIGLMFIILQTILQGQADASLTVVPVNTLAVVGDAQVELNCSTNMAEPVHWARAAPGGESNDIFRLGGIVKDFQKRFNISESASQTQYNLIIRDIEFADAGHYTCTDEDLSESAFKEKRYASAELIVLGPAIDVEHNISETGLHVGSDKVCGLDMEQDIITMTCTIEFKGNIPPAIHWKQDGNNDVITEGVFNETVHNIRTTSSLVIYAHADIHLSQFHCSVEFTDHRLRSASIPDSFNNTWKSPQIQIISFPHSDAISDNVDHVDCLSEEERLCSVETNLPCNYTWINEESQLTVHSHVLKLDSTHSQLRGTFRCTVTCPIGDRECKVSTSSVHVTSSCSEHHTYNGILWILLGLACIVILAFIIVRRSCIRRIFCQKKKKKMEIGIEEAAAAHSEGQLLHLNTTQLPDTKNYDPLVMSAEHKKKLAAARNNLLDTIDMSLIIDDLLLCNVLSQEDVDFIDRGSSKCEKAEIFLDIIPNKPDSAYNVVVRILNSNKQSHVADLLEKPLVDKYPVKVKDHIVDVVDGPSASEKYLNYPERIPKLRPVLIAVMECQFGLLDILVGGYLSVEQFYEIKSENNPCKQNEKLLDLLHRKANKKEFEFFLDALRETNQNHLVAYICNNGAVDACGDNRPLTTAEQKMVQHKRTYLIQHIDPTLSLLTRLYSHNVVSQRHVVHVHQFGDQYRRTTELLDILLRRSYAQFKTFLECLDHTYLGYIANELRKFEGGTVRNVAF